MKLSTLDALSRLTGARLEWLVYGQGPMRASETGEMQAGDELAGDDLVAPIPGTVLISRYDARASAGPGNGLSEGAILGQVAFSEAWVRRSLGRDPAQLALLEARGDSMEPTIRDGDVIMIDTSAMEIVSGRIYVLRVDGELMLKRLQRRVNGAVVVLSDNPRYPPEEVPQGQSAPTILGEVLWRGHRV